MADPNSSGTAWTMLATIVQLMGEDKAFDYMKAAERQHQRIHQGRRGAGARRRAGRDADRHRLPARHHRRRRTPQAGRGGVAVRGHRLRDRLDEPDQGRAAHGRGEEVLRVGVDAGRRRSSPRRPAASRSRPTRRRRCRRRRPTCRKIKLIEYDFATYGSSATRTRLLGALDQRGEERAEIVAEMRRKPRMRRALPVWLAVGWAVVLVLPWYGLDERRVRRRRCSAGPRLAMAAGRCRCWWRPGRRGRAARGRAVWRSPAPSAWPGSASRRLRSCSTAGAVAWLTALLGPGPTQPALGWGAVLYALACTMLLACGLARAGPVQGRRVRRRRAPAGGRADRAVRVLPGAVHPAVGVARQRRQPSRRRCSRRSCSARRSGASTASPAAAPAAWRGTPWRWRCWSAC